MGIDLRALVITLVMACALYFTYGQFSLPWMAALPVLIALLVSGLPTPASLKRALPVLSLGLVLAFLTITAASLLPDIEPLKSVIVDVADQSYLPWMRGLLALAGVLSVALFFLNGRKALIVFVALALVMTAFYALIIPTSPKPYIDVWTLHEQAADAFAHFQNPYTIDYVNIYPKELWPSLTPFGVNFAYLPGVFMWMAPFKAIGLDTRYSQVFAELLTSLAILGISFRVSRDRARNFLTYVPALVFLTFPVTTFFLVRAWNDDISVLFFAVAGLALVSGQAWMLFVGCNALFLLKQYAILFVPFLVWYAVKKWNRGWSEATLKSTFFAVAVGAAYTIYDWRNFLGSLYGLHFLKHPEIHQLFPDRTDPYSLMNYLHLFTGFHLSWLFVIAVAFIAVRMVMKKPSAASLLRGLAAMAFAMVIFAPVAFANYYEYAWGLFVVGWAASNGSRSSASSEDADAWEWPVTWWSTFYVASRACILFIAGFISIDTHAFSQIAESIAGGRWPYRDIAYNGSPLSLIPAIFADSLQHHWERTDFLSFHSIFAILILVVDVAVAIAVFRGGRVRGTGRSTLTKAIFVLIPLLLSPYYLTCAWILNSAVFAAAVIAVWNSRSYFGQRALLSGVSAGLLVWSSLALTNYDVSLDPVWAPTGFLIALVVTTALFNEVRTWVFPAVLGLASTLTLWILIHAEDAVSGTGLLSRWLLVRNGLVALSVILLLGEFYGARAPRESDRVRSDV